MPNIFDDTTLIAGRNHEKHNGFTGFGMLHDRGSAFVNSWRSRDFRFHLGKAHADSPHLYEFIGSSFNPEVAFMVTASEVAGFEPTASKLALRGLGIFEIS